MTLYASLWRPGRAEGVKNPPYEAERCESCSGSGELMAMGGCGGDRHFPCSNCDGTGRAPKRGDAE